MIYVSPRGDDRNPGTRERPLASVQRALTLTTGPKEIVLRGGFYPLASPLRLGPGDKGTRLQALRGETPVLSGGTQVTGWREVAPGRWQVRWETPVEQLYIGTERRYRPTLPKSGYYLAAGDTLPGARGFHSLVYQGGDINPGWANLDQVEIEAYQIWTMARMRVKTIDAGNKTVHFTGETIGKEAYQAIGKGKRFRVVNVKEALTTPGEWYWDKRARTLTYLAKPGENPNKLGVYVPRLETLLVVDNTADIHFDNITFAHSAWLCPPEGNSFYQAEVHLPDTIRVTAAREIVFDSCTIRNTGNWAIAFGPGARECELRGCTLIDLGAGGVRIGEQGLQKDPARLTERITVEDCLLAEGGRLHPAAVGVWIGHSPYNRIVHNEIVDFYYTGISPGWSWGYAESGAHHNELAWNQIHRIGQGVLSDMGGIYTLGVSPGTTLHHNLIHDIQSYDYGGWGIYYDEGSTGIVSENNLVYRTKSAPFHQHYGRDNVVRNNILALGIEAQLMRTRAEDHLSVTIERNIVYWTEGPLLGSNWSGTPGKNFILRNNLYWNPSGAKPDLGEKDTTSLFADPLFLAPAEGDFRLKPSSPARQIGFVPFDLSDVGPRRRALYRGKAPSAFPPVVRRELPAGVREDFEGSVPGATPSGPGLYLSVETGTGSAITVTEETAAQGKRAVKVVDAPGQKARYNPHFAYNPNLTKGTITGRFALRLGTGPVVFYHEWRDGSSPYRVGPSLRIEGGMLRVGSETLAKIEPDVWMDWEIVHTLGSGVWQLTRRRPGRAVPQRWTNLPCGNGKEMTNLRWWGFVSDADTATTFYLDQLELFAT